MFFLNNGITITNLTIVGSPEKMRPQNTGYSTNFPQVKTSLPCKNHNQDKIKTKSDVKKRQWHLIPP